MAKTQFHRNLNSGAWSYIPPGSKTLSCPSAYLSNVDMRHPSTGNKAFLNCLDGGSRKVFAWFKADEVCPCDVRDEQVPDDVERIYFNPTKGDMFFSVLRDGEQVKVDHAVEVYALEGGLIFGRGFTTGAQI